MVNSGAMATVSLVAGASADAKWANVVSVLTRFAGRELVVDEEVYASASATNHRNQEIARLLDTRGALHWAPRETVDLYTRAVFAERHCQGLGGDGLDVGLRRCQPAHRRPGGGSRDVS